MGNLGAYQDIVVKAKDAGGVEKLIESIEKSAALKAMPKGFAAGVAATIATVVAIKQYSKRSMAREDEANEAKARLTADLGDLTAPHNANADGTESGPSDGFVDPPGSETPA